MFKKIRSFFVMTILSLGGYELSRFFTRNKPRVIMFHRFSEQPSSRGVDHATFFKQLDLLQQKFNVIPLTKMIACLEEHKPFPKHAIVLTVDDGYEDFYRIAFPELKRRHMPATVFVTTGFIDWATWLWPDYASYLLDDMSERGEVLELPDMGQNFLLPEQNRQCWQTLMDRLIPMPLDEKRVWLFELAAKVGVVFPTKIPKRFRPMSWQQIRELDANGINIGAHTVNHPNLSRETNEKVEWEVQMSKAVLEAKLNHPVDLFCYPNGEQYDYTPVVERIVAEAGFCSAMAAHCDYISMNNRFALPRFSVSNNWFHFRKVIYGVQWLLKSFL